MPAIMKKNTGYPCWVKLEHPSFGDFEIKIRRPTAIETATDEATLMRSFNADREDSVFFQSQRRQFRAFGLVMDWRGVVGEPAKEGDPPPEIPFTPENLLAFVGEHPEAFAILSNIGDEVLAGKPAPIQNGWNASPKRPDDVSLERENDGRNQSIATRTPSISLPNSSISGESAA